jgi:hypothetical protein
MVDESCRCGHTRFQHGERDNRLEVRPLGKTEADPGDNEEIPTLVRGEGPCKVPGCGCEQFVLDQ